MALNQTETFEWLRERSNRLDQLEKDFAELQERHIKTVLDLAFLQTAEQRKELLESENIPAEIWNMRLQSSQPVEASTAELPQDGLSIAINACKDVTRIGRFSASVDPVRWVAQLQAHLESLAATPSLSEAEGLSAEEECHLVKAVVHGNCKGETRHREATCDAFLCLPELRPEHYALVNITLTRNALDALLQSASPSESRTSIRKLIEDKRDEWAQWSAEDEIDRYDWDAKVSAADELLALLEGRE